MSRCWGCAQENCAYGTACGCSCHAPVGYEDGPNRSTYQPLEDATSLAGVKIGIMARTHTEDWTGYVLCPCQKHKRYQAKRPPRSTCEACWRFYVKVNP
jgi:hypothetical protein